MNNKDSFVKRIWNKIPLIIRAIILGFFISSIGVISWSLLATFIPMPWSFILMIALLWFYIKYFELDPQSPDGQDILFSLLLA